MDKKMETTIIYNECQAEMTWKHVIWGHIGQSKRRWKLSWRYMRATGMHSFTPCTYNQQEDSVQVQGSGLRIPNDNGTCDGSTNDNRVYRSAHLDCVQGPLSFA